MSGGGAEAGAAAELTIAGRTVAVAAGTPLHQALLQNGYFVETPCGARGTCRKCRVRLGGDVPPPTPADGEHLTPAEVAEGFRLSCQHVAAGRLEVAILPVARPDPRKAALGRLAEGEAEVEPWAPLVLAPGGFRPCGLAVDIGTTTVVAALLDLRTGEELAAASLPNPQGSHGADLMSRLTYAISAPEAPGVLRDEVRGAVDNLAARLCRRAGVPARAVVAVTVVGNTCMHHLFLGLPVGGLAAAPYRPATVEPVSTPAGDLGLTIHPQAPVYTLPGVAGFVGADALAAALAAGLDRTRESLLLVDIGTNGEAVLVHRGEVWAASAPAGPAFEGGEISMGMRANPGAVERVDWDGTGLQIGVIPGAPARGICGSGLLDAVAALRQAGVLDAGGRMQAAGPLAGRVRTGDWDGLGFVLAGPAPGEALRPVVLTQKDIRQLQLAKGAVRAGAEVLLRAAGIAASDLDGILLAGAFGNYLRPEAALAVGLLPGVPVERVRPVGNAAAQGAKLALLSRSARERAEALARRIRHVESATYPGFEEIFMDALSFPER